MAGIEALSDISRAGKSAFDSGGGSAFFKSELILASSNGQSTFPVTGGYFPGYAIVFLNGSKIEDFVQTSGTDIVLSNGLPEAIVIGDELTVVSFTAFNVADALPLLGKAVDADKLDGNDSSYFGTAANVAANTAAIAQQALTLETAQATTTGTLKDFTIPAGAKRITVAFALTSTNGAAALLIQIGAGTVQTTGYSSVGNSVASTVGTLTSTAGFVIGSGSGANSSHSGSVAIHALNAETYTASGTLSDLTNSCSRTCQGSVSVVGGATVVRVTTVNGTDVFDAGMVNVMWEL